MNDVVRSSRLSVNITADTAEFLREAKDREGRSVTEIIRRAIGVYKFVAYDHAGDIWVETADGKRSKVMVL